jgi:hypothetical protein
MRRFGTNDNQLIASPRFGRSAIFASVIIAIPVLTSVGLLAAGNIDLKPHREIVDIHKYPWSPIGKIGIMGYSSGQLCTGAVIGPNVFLTAAHCLYNKPTGGFMPARGIHILIGYEKGEYRAHRVASHYTIPPALDKSAFTHLRPGPKKLWAAASYDWAIVYTSEPFPSDVRPLRLASTIPSLGTAVMIGGYPIERNCVTHHGDSGGVLLSADDQGLIFGVNSLAYDLRVELREQSKEGGVAVSAASITEFLGSQVVGRPK